MKKKKEYFCNFQEEVITQDYAYFKEQRRSKIFYFIFTQGMTKFFLEWSAKYLLHIEKLQPVVAQKFLRRYTIVIVYSWLKEKHNYTSINEFDRILENPLTSKTLFVELINDLSHPLVRLFNNGDNYEDNKEFNECIYELKKEINKLSKGETAIDLLKIVHIDYFIYRKGEPLFSLNPSSGTKGKVRKIDQIISEAISNKEFKKFDIHIDEDNVDKFKSNIFIDEEYKIKRMMVLALGFIVDDMIKNDNYDMSKNVDISRLESIKEMTFDKNDKFFTNDASNLKFMDRSGNINKDEIEEFEFIFNNKKYSLSKEGLKEISSSYVICN